MTINEETEEQPAPVSAAAASSVGPMPSVLPKKEPWHRNPAVRRAAPFAITAVVALFIGFGVGDVQGASLQAQNKALTHEVKTLKAKVAGQKIALSSSHSALGSAETTADSCTNAYNLEVKAAHQMANAAAELDDGFVQYMSDFDEGALNTVAAQANTDSATAIATQKQAYAAGCGDGSGDGS